MERLKEERDKLAEAMAESNKDYEDLLAENEKLTQMVAEAEENARNNPNKKFKNTFKVKIEPKAPEAAA